MDENRLVDHIVSLWPQKPHDEDHYYFGLPGAGTVCSAVVFAKYVRNTSWGEGASAQLRKWSWYTHTENPQQVFDTPEEAIRAASASLARLVLAMRPLWDLESTPAPVMTTR